MKIGISTASFAKKLNTEDSLEKIKNLGVTVADVSLATFYEYRPEFSKKLSSELNGLQINSVRVNHLNFEGNLFNPSRRISGDGYYWLDQVARSAQLLKCDNYTFCGCLSSEIDDINFVTERIARAYDFMLGYAVNLCIENTSEYVYNRPGIFKAVKERCQNIYGILNLKEAKKSCYPCNMYIKELQGAIAYVILSDFDEYGEECLPGEGMYNFNEIITSLRDCGFDGNLLIDCKLENVDEDRIKNSIDNLNEIVYKLN